MSPALRERLRRAAPFVVAAAWLALGYANLVRGVAHPGVAYRPWAFRHHSYSDILALSGDRYLGGGRPVPYLQDRIEYPVLLGFTLYLPSFVPGGQWAHFTVSVLFLAACLFAAVAVLARMPGANPWWLAATPALAYYGALNWDLLPIALLFAALWQHERARPGRSGALASLGVCAKLWPVAAAPSVLAALAGERRWRAALGWTAAFAAVAAAVNLPVALLAPENWGHFFRYNAGRFAENSVWEIWALRDPKTLNALGAAFLAASALAAAAGAYRASAASRARAVRLGTALVLVVWIATNKVYSPQYALYAFAGAALVSPPAWLFAALSAISVVDYHLAFEVRAGRGVFWFFDRWYFLEEAARTAIYAALAAWLVAELWRAARTPGAEGA